MASDIFSQILKIFFKPKTDPSRKEIDAFVVAADIGNDVMVRKFLQEYGRTIINRKDSSGWTALMKAVSHGYNDIIMLLLDGDAAID